MDSPHVDLKRKHKRANLLDRFLSREINRPRPGTGPLQSRAFYQNVYPNHTVYDVETPSSFIKKFTSDGQHLLCIGRSLQSVELYRFRGPYAGKWGCDANFNSPTLERKWDNYFTIVYERTFVEGSELLCRDFCLTTACGSYFILASSGRSINNTTSETTTATTQHRQQHLNTSPASPSSPASPATPESLSNTKLTQSTDSQSLGLSNLEDVTFYLVGVKDGIVYDKITFKRDYIHLNHHSGVYLYDKLFAVLSLERQAIEIFQVEDGKFIKLHSVGHHCNEDDELEIAVQREIEAQFNGSRQSMDTSSGNIPEPASDPAVATIRAAPTCPHYFSDASSGCDKPAAATEESAVASSMAVDSEVPQYGKQGFITGLRHRLMVRMLSQAQSAANPQLAMRLFFQQFPHLAALVMWKMQFLDNSHILIKFGPIEGITSRSADLTNQLAFFVVYNVHTTEIVDVYDNSSKEFAWTFEQFCEHFRACSSPLGSIKFRSTCSNNNYVREHLHKQKQAMLCAKNGSESQAVRRLLSALPFSPQSWSESPYFDKSLFSYEEKVISSTERPKPCAEYPVKFHLRATGQVKFRLSPGVSLASDSSIERSKRYASYIFHPFYPFAISVQQGLLQPQVVNFHFWREENEQSTSC